MDDVNFQFDVRGVTQAPCMIEIQGNRGKVHVDYGLKKFSSSIASLGSRVKGSFFKVEIFKYL